MNDETSKIPDIDEDRESNSQTDMVQVEGNDIPPVPREDSDVNDETGMVRAELGVKNASQSVPREDTELSNEERMMQE